MSSKFQKGDQVKVVSKDEEVEEYTNQTGTIVKIESEDTYPYKVEFEDGEVENFAAIELKSLEFAKKEPMGTFSKLTTLAKKVVDADLRNMIKAGWLDGSLNLTEEGRDVVLADYLSENKAKFGKMAEEELKDKRKEKKEDC